MNSTAAGQGIAIDDLTFNATSPANPVWNTTSGNWDTTSTNWTGGSPNANQYKDTDNVTFNNQNGVGGTVNLTGNVTPAAPRFGPIRHLFLHRRRNRWKRFAQQERAGTLDLTAQISNGYTGGTNLNGGWLVISNDSQLGSGSITMGGGTLLTAAAIASTKTITLTPSTSSTIDTGVSASTVGAISGGGNFIVAGTGSLRLTSVNNYSGTTTINSVRSSSAAQRRSQPPRQ